MICSTLMLCYQCVVYTDYADDKVNETIPEAGIEFLEINKEKIISNRRGASDVIVLNTSGSWEITKTLDWVSLSSLQGTPLQETSLQGIAYQILANPNPWQRTATIEIRMGSLKKSIEVVQNFEANLNGDGLIEIYDFTDLENIRYNLSGTSYKTKDMSKAEVGITTGCPEIGCHGYKLMNDLDFNLIGEFKLLSKSLSQGATLNSSQLSVSTIKKSWLPIGDCGGDVCGNENDTPFLGKFEGNGHVIKNLYIKNTLSDGQALFGRIGGNAEINNLGVLSAEIIGKNNCGILVGMMSGDGTSTPQIVNSYVTGTVQGGDYVGGIIGEQRQGVLMNSFSRIEAHSSGSYLGGLVGVNNGGKIQNTYSSGQVVGTQIVGGVVGLLKDNSSIENNYSTAIVIGSSSGGMIGVLGSGDNHILGDNYYFDTISNKGFGVGSSSNVIRKNMNMLNYSDREAIKINFTETDWDWNTFDAEGRLLLKYNCSFLPENIPCGEVLKNQKQLIVSVEHPKLVFHAIGDVLKSDLDKCTGGVSCSYISLSWEKEIEDKSYWYRVGSSNSKNEIIWSKPILTFNNKPRLSIQKGKYFYFQAKACKDTKGIECNDDWSATYKLVSYVNGKKKFELAQKERQTFTIPENVINVKVELSGGGGGGGGKANYGNEGERDDSTETLKGQLVKCSIDVNQGALELFIGGGGEPGGAGGRENNPGGTGGFSGIVENLLDTMNGRAGDHGSDKNLAGGGGGGAGGLTSLFYSNEFLNNKFLVSASGGNGQGGESGGYHSGGRGGIAATGTIPDSTCESFGHAGSNNGKSGYRIGGNLYPAIKGSDGYVTISW